MTIVQLLSTGDSEEERKYASELTIVHKKLQERDAEVIELQKKVIELYEQLHKKVE